MRDLMENRDFMKCPPFLEEKNRSDQNKDIPHPPHSKPPRGELILLPSFEAENSPLTLDSYETLLDVRRSIRKYDEITPMTREQLAFLLWSAGGIQAVKGHATLRPTPSGGARHPFELYAAVQNVKGLEAGIYRYVPAAYIGEKQVAIEYVKPFTDYKSELTDAVMGQGWAAGASVSIFVTSVPYKSEWRYRALAHRVILIDLGHLGQNLMFSAASMGLGSCCMAAYNQDLCDTFLGVDGVNEYTVYVVSVGTLP